ncbi:hypothetical protein [uncultured Flavobacterium sp.]|uniref:FEKKY domain-containing protein n=1 Tax=uncultured Flavobacterium sp. TaxID=165435 RepID=UPI0025F83FCD|nr:hypothetical protein [uncultured Flavobacterium sp.]
MKKIKLVYFMIILVSSFSYSQQKQQRGCTKHLVISAKMNFEEDLKNNSMVIYLKGGIVSVITKEDQKFEKLYSIRYHDFGCVMPEDPTYYESYNHFAFEYLKEKHGNDWKKIVNKNVFGWKD